MHTYLISYLGLDRLAAITVYRLEEYQDNTQATPYHHADVSPGVQRGYPFGAFVQQIHRGPLSHNQMLPRHANAANTITHEKRLLEAYGMCRTAYITARPRRPCP